MQVMSRFLITIFSVIAFILGFLAYTIFFIPPTDLLLAIVLILIGLMLSLIIALIIYAFSSPRGFESDRLIFRRSFKKGLIIGLISILLFGIQIIFDVL